MILLSNILKEASVDRGKKTNMDSAEINKLIKVLDSKCNIAYDKFKEKVYLMRGIKNTSAWFYMNQAHKERKSAYTSNFYNLIFSNHPAWKEYPKRSLSTIGSGDRNKAGLYADQGSIFYCFPVGNPDIGICPDSDIWGSFNLNGADALGDLNDFIGLTYACFNDIDTSDTDSNDDANITYEKLYKGLDVPDRDFSKNVHDAYYRLAGGNSKYWDKLMSSGKKNAIDFVVDEYLDPKKNGFKLRKLEELSRSDINDNEIWWSGPTLFIREEFIK